DELSAAFAAQRHVEQEAPFDLVVPRQDLAQTGFDLVGQDVGEEAETTTVDAHHGQALLGQHGGGFQHAAVAAHHDHELTYGAHFAARAHAEAMRLQEIGDVVVHHDVDSLLLLQKSGEGIEGIDDVAIVAPADDADISEPTDFIQLVDIGHRRLCASVL